MRTRSSVVSACLLALGTAALVIGTQPGALARSVDRRTGIDPWEAGLFLKNVREFSATNVGSVRINVEWAEIEPQPDAFSWDELDHVVDTARASDMDVLMTLRSISAWGAAPRPADAKEGHGATMPRDMKRWDAFVSATAQRYKGHRVAYEIENEPNANFWAGSMDEYVSLLKATYASIHTTDPDAVVVSGALACHVVFDYRNAAVEERQNRQFDVWQKAILATHAFTAIGVHDYYFPDRTVNGWTFASYLGHVRNLARASGCATCPVWITETGYVSRPQTAGRRTDPGSPDQQAAWARQALAQAFGAGVERVFWLFLRDHPATGYFASMGLFDGPVRERPAFAVLAQSTTIAAPAGR